MLDLPLNIRSVVSEALFSAGYLTLSGMSQEDNGSVASRFAPDVVIVALDRDWVPPLEPAVRELRGVPMLALTPANPPAEVRVEARRAGIDSIFVEPWDANELVARVDSLMDRRRPRRRLRVGDLTIDHDAHIVTYRGEEVSVTLTEYNLLLDLMNNAGHVLSKRQLLERVWGFDDYNPNLVEVHIAALRKKLGAVGADMIETVRGVGYVIRPACQTLTLDGSTPNDEHIE